MRPEVFSCKSSASVSSDIWSYGMTVAELYLDQHPFPLKFEDLEQEMTTIFYKQMEPNLTRIPTGLGSIISDCVDYNPNNRPSASEILVSMQASGFN